MRVLSVNSNNYISYPKFTAKNNRNEHIHHNPKSNLSVPAMLLAMSIISGTNACTRDTLDIDRLKDKEDTFERADSTKEDNPPFDVIVDTTFNEIIHDIIIFNE